MSSNIQNVVLYLRKSRDEENQGSSNVLAKHRMKLVEQAKAYGWNILATFEEVASSIDPTRPKYVEMQEFCKTTKVDAILVYALDRLNRDLEEGSRCYKWLEREGILLVAAGNVYDLANNDSRNMAEVLLTFSGMEYRAIKGRMKGGKLAGTRLGRWSHGTPPMGYTYNPTTKSLDVEPEGMKLYEYMKANLLSGKSIRQITFALNHAGIPAPKGGTWGPAVVRQILQSRVYVGETRYADAVGYGDWGVTTEEEYARIALQIKQNNAVKTRSASASIRKLSTLVVCAKCGKCHTWGWARNRSFIQMKPCKTEGPTGERCINSGVRESVLAEMISDELRMIFAYIKQEMKPIPTKVNDNALLEGVQEAIRKAEGEMVNLRKYLREGVLTAEEYKQDKADVETRLAELRKEEVKLVKLHTDAGITEEEKLDRIKNALDSLADEDADPAEVNRLLKLVIDRIIWNRDSSTAPITFEVVLR